MQDTAGGTSQEQRGRITSLVPAAPTAPEAVQVLFSFLCSWPRQVSELSMGNAVWRGYLAAL